VERKRREYWAKGEYSTVVSLSSSCSPQEILRAEGGTYFKTPPLSLRKRQFWGEVTKRRESTNRRLKLLI